MRVLVVEDEVRLAENVASALREGPNFAIVCAERSCGDFAPYESKSVPQRLKPSSAQTITARLNPCPSFDSLLPSLSGAV
jgi:hypothetical protein